MTKEFDFFNSPNISKLLDLVLQLSAEVHMTNQRVRILQMQLERQGALQSADIERFVPDAYEQAALDESREAMMARLMQIMTEAGPAEYPLREQWEKKLEGHR